LHSKSELRRRIFLRKVEKLLEMEMGSKRRAFFGLQKEAFL